MGNRLLVRRDTLSDEHLMGTAAGVMRSRAIRRLEEPARWVPVALNAILFTPWSPQLKLPGRPRLQRPAYEEPIEARTLRGFIEIPAAPTTKNSKSEKFVTTPGDAEQSTKRQRQEVTFREPQQTSSSSGAVADTSMQILDPQMPKPARPLSPAEREDIIPKRQRPAELNTVLAIASGDSSFEIFALTDDQNALRTAKVIELLNVDKFVVVEVVDRPSQQVISTRWVSKQRLDGSYKVRLVARGFEQTVSSDTDFHAGTPCAHFSRSLQFTETQLLLEIVTINHRCQVNQNQCMWSQPRTHSWTIPRYGKDSRFLFRPGVFTANRKSTT